MAVKKRSGKGLERQATRKKHTAEGAKTGDARSVMQ